MLNFIFRFFMVLLSQDTAELANKAQANAPTYLTADTAMLHAVAAKMAATPQVSADLLIGMAWVESRYYPTATSRLENGVRVVGIPKWTDPPAYVTGPFFCGVTQAEAEYSWARCIELRNIFTVYQTTAIELGKWFRSPSCTSADDLLQCVLWGYGGGHPAIEAKTSTYPARVIWRAGLLKRKPAS